MIIVGYILGIIAASLGICWIFGWPISMIREIYLERKAKKKSKRTERRKRR